jgi:hypothetical protein
VVTGAHAYIHINTHTHINTYIHTGEAANEGGVVVSGADAMWEERVRRSCADAITSAAMVAANLEEQNTRECLVQKPKESKDKKNKGSKGGKGGKGDGDVGSERERVMFSGLRTFACKILARHAFFKVSVVCVCAYVCMLCVCVRLCMYVCMYVDSKGDIEFILLARDVCMYIHTYVCIQRHTKQTIVNQHIYIHKYIHIHTGRGRQQRKWREKFP